ncbi:hypothetical protein KEJ18_07110 [Candidatus Bathyarchaeota archaeon]|nr:hypothetical protein [Candidatus Bathyarchaeota archaeon]
MSERSQKFGRDFGAECFKYYSLYRFENRDDVVNFASSLAKRVFPKPSEWSGADYLEFVDAFVLSFVAAWNDSNSKVSD